jgi:ABC-2 type transport system permease protein
MLVVFAVPVLLVCLLGLSHGSSRHGAGLVGQYGQFMYPVAAAYVSLVLLNIIYNSFGYDGNGIEWLYMAPVRFRQVLVGKNVTVVLLMTMNLVILWIAVGVVATPPGAMVVLPTIAAVAFLLLVHFSIGNLMSLQLPRRVSIGFSRNRVAGVSGLASLMVSAVSLAICAAAFGVGFWLGRMWIAAAVLAVFAVVVSPAYRWSLRRCDDLAMKQREVLVAELVRRE